MKSLVFTGLLLLCGQSAFANLSWRLNSDNVYDCAAVTPDGEFQQWLPKQECRAVSTYTVSWREVGGQNRWDCAEVTPWGGFISWIPRQECRNAGGYTLSWREVPGQARWECAEVTTLSHFVSWLQRDECRKVGGYHVRWSQLENGRNVCVEVTSNGDFVGITNTAACGG